MTAPSRTAQFARVHKVLKKHFKPAPFHAGRTVIEHLLFACGLEDTRHDAAEEAFAALVHTFFDWNEVRVTSISELSEVLASLPDPRAAANRVKRVLHAVFEATFNFDLEEYRKKNLGPTVAWLKKLDGTTRFTVSYVVQAALGGHAIPIDGSTMAALHVLDLMTEKDVEAKTVPGLERAVAKSKGGEFGSLLHELGAAYSANPYSSTIREILLKINPECEDRLPKRRVKRAKRKPQDPPRTKKKGVENKASTTGKPAETKRKSGTGKKSAAPDTSQAEQAQKSRKKKPAAPSKPVSQKKSSSRTVASKKRSSSEGLSKRKPR
ncbi:MAG: hypothetical protein K8R46_10090 [Pirellulales bacterium]|nr:hypothetical protein [Pirellulales bacterium]